MYEVVIGVVTPPIWIWLYLHCDRPMLADQGARPRVFWLVAAATVVVIVLSVLIAIVALQTLVTGREPDFEALWSLLHFGAIIALVPAAAGTLAPSFLTRIFGGCDPQTRFHFLIDTFGSKWRKAAGDAAAERELVDQFARLVAWSGRADWFTHDGSVVADYIGADTTTDVAQARDGIARMLAANEPFDPVSWVHRRRWASRVRRDAAKSRGVRGRRTGR